MSTKFSFILEDGQKITKMMVRHGDVVDGIGFEITNESGNISRVWYSPNSGNISEIPLEPEEYITHISGAYGKYYGQRVLVGTMTIYTNLNPTGYGPYGRAFETRELEAFVTPLPLNSQLVGFFGEYGDPYLTSIGAYAKYGPYGRV